LIPETDFSINTAAESLHAMTCELQFNIQQMVADLKAEGTMTPELERLMVAPSAALGMAVKQLEAIIAVETPDSKALLYLTANAPH
jgi:hypothetical protein